MSKESFYNLVDKVSRDIVRNIAEIEQELERTGDRDSEAVRRLLPSVLLSIAILRLCNENPPDEVINILKTVTLKVEMGDYHPGGLSFKDSPPQDQDDDEDDDDDGSSGGNGEPDPEGSDGHTIN
jgi:hypothetical protein